jgi:RNase H-fold protein (predicted Holliday junction resolvase)
LPKSIVSALLLVAAGSCLSQERNIDYPESGAALGVGWNSALVRQADAYCVDFQPTPALAQTSDTAVTDFRLTESLGRASGVSVGMSAITAAKIGGSGAAKFVHEFTSDLQTQSYALVMHVWNRPEVAGPAKNAPLALKDVYVKRFDAEGPAYLPQFLKECGDAFVERRYGGASLIGVLSFRELAEESKSDVTVDFSVNGVVIGFKSSMTDMEKRKRIEQATQFKATLNGGSGATGAFDKATFNALAATVPQLAASAPAYIRMDVRPYESLTNWPKSIKQSVTYTRLSLATSMYTRMNQLFTAANLALANRGSYIALSYFESDLQQIAEEATAVMARLEPQIKACVEDVSTCEALSKVDDLDYYWAYSRMPLKRGSNLFDQGLLDLETQKAAAQKTADTAIEALANAFRRPRETCDSIDVELAKMMRPPPSNVAVTPGMGQPPRIFMDAKAACDGVKALQATIEAKGGGEAAAVAETAAQVWVRGLSSEYCRLNPTDTKMCLSPSRVDQLVAEIRDRGYGRFCGYGTNNLQPCTRAAPKRGPYPVVGTGLIRSALR